MAEGVTESYGAKRSQPPALRTLSSEQKRELAALAAAGIASALFFLVPFLGTATPQQPVPVSRTIVGMALVAPARPAGVPVRHARRANVPRPPLTDRRIAAASLADAAVTFSSEAEADADAGHGEEATHRPGPITRALFGDGRYRVQPFPTVEDRD